jgi:ABC-type nickel/cobalt efflux system permease component RcnA
MKNFLLFLTVTFLCMNSALPHGIDGHSYRADEDREASRGQQTSRCGKSLTQPATEEGERWWGARLSTGWTSRQIHYGIDETGDYGAYTTELTMRIQNLVLSVWSGFGTRNDYQEWDFTVAYNLKLGAVFLTPGYNFRYQPGVVEHEHSDSGEDEAAHHEEHPHAEEDGHHEHHEHSHVETGHSHNTYGNEIFFVLGTTAIRYVTPSMLFLCDLNNTPGSYLEIRLDGDIPLYRDILKLKPYALLSLNLGYNTTAYYGWNSFQFGLEAIPKLP